MEVTIYSLDTNGTSDHGVPEFGKEFGTIKSPDSFQRREAQNLVEPDLRAALQASALERIKWFTLNWNTPDALERPRVHFPNAELIQHFGFPESVWQNYQDPETEYQALQFVLNHFQERALPVSFQNFLADKIPEGSNLLEERGKNYETLKLIAAQELHSLIGISSSQKDVDNGGDIPGAFVVKPAQYKTSEVMQQQSIKLWEQAVTQISNEIAGGNTANVKSFLSLYGRLKDPLTIVDFNLDLQAAKFTELLASLKIEFGDNLNNLDPAQLKVLVAQLALESSFLALPAVANDEITSLLVDSVHELPIMHVDITTLPRGEMANPKRVAGEVQEGEKSTLQELLDDYEEYQAVVTTPITVSYMQAPDAKKPILGILDGNNRVTAVMLMKFLAEVDYDFTRLQNKQELVKFKEKYNLDVEWERDLFYSAKELAKNAVLQERIEKDHDFITKIANAKIAALLVQESNYLTVDVSGSTQNKLHVLQPQSQYSVNQNKFLYAFGSKLQSHGRVKGANVKISVVPLPEELISQTQEP
ncbi:MAG: hypothetical protein WCJ58_05070 [bacterium]